MLKLKFEGLFARIPGFTENAPEKNSVFKKTYTENGEVPLPGLWWRPLNGFKKVEEEDLELQE